MSKEQIEEIANVIYDDPNSYDTYWRSHCERLAETIYNAGYRKQSEGEWKKFQELYPRYVCTACNHLFNNKSYKYCPNCGAKMKGGAE